LNKKYGIAAVIAFAIVAGVLAFTYNNTSQTNPAGPSQQPNGTNPAGPSQQPNGTNPAGPSQQPNASNSVTAKPASTSGRHFFASVNETVKVKSNP